METNSMASGRITSSFSREGLVTRIYYAADVKPGSALALTLTDFVNESFKAVNIYDPDKWDLSCERLNSPDEIHEMLGVDGLLVVLYDGNLPIASAGAIPWRGDVDGFTESGETGWEIKTVTVRIGYLKHGLAGLCIEALQEKILENDKSLENSKNDGENGKLCLWVQAAEAEVGDYWKRRGWSVVRAYDMPVGFWVSKTGFRMLVMIKWVDLTTEAESTAAIHATAERQQGGGSAY
jgi:hypothetical protein